MTRRAKLGLALGVAAVLAGGLIVASVLATREGETTVVVSGATLPGGAEVAARLRGIPQQRFTLGRADAPVTLVEYADLQCPFCAQWTVNVFPELVRDYVRTGKLRLEWGGLAFIGPDSVTALRAVDAAALQNRLWHLAELVYLNQGEENSGWVALLGVAIAGYIEFERATRGQIACGTGGCEEVQSSKYAELLGIPVAVLGLVAYLAVFATALVRAPAAALAGAALAVAGLAFALYLLAVQAYVLEAYCTWCLASDAVLAGLAVLTAIRAARV